MMSYATLAGTSRLKLYPGTPAREGVNACSVKSGYLRPCKAYRGSDRRKTGCCGVMQASARKKLASWQELIARMPAAISICWFKKAGLNAYLAVPFFLSSNLQGLARNR